ncbi:Alpha/beta hydrolase family protein [Planctomycetes bacterium Poly30]|uniref:Alpha/beta hydrolase family protein n=1 Tax=Saltatorellus ferox TaxID=2528018 RepID=A0A518EML3_9BACT|nr:Alpha/beta hydrolase family protein [Planctomycetes bacterium Poly30]
MEQEPVEGAEPRGSAGRVARVLFGLLLIGGLAGLGSSWWMAGRLSAPAPSSIVAPPAGLEVEAFTATDARGRSVRGWCVAAEGVGAEAPRGVVILLHGIRGNRTAMVRRARFLALAGYASVLVDLHAHGESDGDRITLGDQERYSVAAAVEHARGLHPSLPVAVIGVSLGGAAAVLGSPLGVQAMVLESVYPDIESAIEHRVGARLGRLGALPAWLLLAQIEPRLGVEPSALRPVDRVSAVGCPVLIASGTEDPHTPPEEAERLFQAAVGSKSLWLVEGAAHVDLHAAAPAEYERRILAFFQEAMRGTGDDR